MIKEQSRAYFRTLGKHISKLRKECGMTQAELARVLGVSQQTVFAYELGDRRVSLFMLEKLADVFGTTVESLIAMAPLPRHRRLSPACVTMAERLQKLSRTQLRFVKKIIDVLLMTPRPKTKAEAL